MLQSQVKERSDFWYGLEVNQFLSYNWSLSIPFLDFLNHTYIFLATFVQTRSFDITEKSGTVCNPFLTF